LAVVQRISVDAYISAYAPCWVTSHCQPRRIIARGSSAARCASWW